MGIIKRPQVKLGRSIRFSDGEVPALKTITPLPEGEWAIVGDFELA